MKLARRERLALITLLSALVALCVDKILLPEPASAIAAVTYTAEQDLMKVTLPPEPATLLREAPQRAAQALLLAVPDVFDRSRLEALIGRPGAEPASAEAQRVSLSAEFRRAHTLRATLLGPRPVALVGDRALRVGDKLDGFVLDSVADREAVFLSDGKRVVLRVASGSGR